MSRVLVTGGAGFIGSQLVRDLVRRGHDVSLLLHPNTSLDRLGDAAGSVRVVEGDVGDPAAVLATLGPWRPDACAHLAWYGDPSTYLTSRENLAQLTASLTFLTTLLDSGCGRLLITGTCAEYEPSDELLTEQSPLGPRTLYAAAKLSLRMLAAQLAADAGASLAWARIFHLYGPNEREQRLVPAVIRTLLDGREFLATAGTQERDYLHVADVASALSALLEEGRDGAFNVCSGIPVTVREVVATIAEIVGQPNGVRFGAIGARKWDPPFLCGDNSLLVKETGWSPSRSLRNGLEDAVTWWRSQVPSRS